VGCIGWLFRVVAAVAAIGVGARVWAQPATRSVVELAHSEPAGRLFELYQAALQPSPEQARRATQLLGGPGGVQNQRTAFSRGTADGLAESALGSADGLLAYFAMMRYYRTRTSDPAQVEAIARNSINVMHLADGRTVNAPVADAVYIHGAMLAEAARALAALRLPEPDLFGQWRIADVRGTCPDVVAGDIRVVERDRLLEGVRGDRRVFYAVAGGRFVFLVIDEARAAVERRSGGRVSVEYPDAERETYRADLTSKDLRFESRTHPGRCAFMLVRPSVR
jgi:hypothetical protein